MKVPVAKRQLAEDEAKRQAELAARGARLGGELAPPSPGGGSGAPASGSQAGEAGPGAREGRAPFAPQEPKNTRFFMSAKLDTTRIHRDVSTLFDEVITHLTSIAGAQVEVTLEVHVKAPGGIMRETARTVSENCRTLKVQSFAFDE